MSVFHANQAQMSAITHISGPMLVMAGPGSGKTFVITERIRYLVEKAGIPPHEILVITFSTAAAREMQERYRQAANGQFSPVHFGTFHAVFFHILQHTYQYQSRNILTNEDRIRILKDIIEENHFQIEHETEWIQDMTACISKKKTALWKDCGIDTENPVQQKVFDDYQRKCMEERLLDFDDMLIRCHRLLNEHQDVLEEWRRQYRYFMIDEFQDINELQYRVIRMLAGEEANIFAVGDDDQSIYGFRGAGPDIMLGFKKDFPAAKQIILNQNYRSTDKIVAASEKLIRHNRNRYEKNMTAAHRAAEEVCIRDFKNQSDELDALTGEIQRLSEDYAYEDMAVLYRTGMSGGEIAERLMLASIPFHAKERLTDLYQHAIARDVTAYARLAMGGRSRKDFYQIMNKPKRYLGRASVKGEQVCFGELLEYYRDQAYMTEAILKLKYDLRFMQSMDPCSMLSYLAKGIGYDRYIAAYAEERKISADTLTEIYEELKERAGHFKTIPEWLTHIEEYEHQLRQQKPDKEKGITLSTIHASKGLEYEVVFVLDVYEGNIPHHKAVTNAETEEERRIFYVAMTRAKQLLYLFYPCKHHGKNMKCSRFIMEISAQKRRLFHRA